MIAHVGGAPVEEALLPLVSGLSAGLLLVRAWAVSHVRHAAAPPAKYEQTSGTGA